MSITPLPSLNRADPTFRADVNTFFGTTLPAFTTELNTEIDRLNTLGFGSYTATSVTSNTIGTGSKSFTIETAKGFVVGQFVIIASTASPGNYLIGQVTSYNAMTGALVVDVTATGGSGTFADWTIAVTAVPLSSIQVDEFLSSGTWTKPAGAKYVIVELDAPGGGGGSGRRGATGTDRYGGGGGGGGAHNRAMYSASELGATESVVVGARGIGGASIATNTTNGNPGTSGGDCTFGNLLKAYGGAGGGGGTAAAIGAFGAGGGTLAAASPLAGAFGGGQTSSAPAGFGGGAGGGGGANSQPGGGSSSGGGGGGSGGRIGNGNAIDSNGADGGSQLEGSAGGGLGGVMASGGVGIGRNGGGGGGPNAAGNVRYDGGDATLSGGGGGGAPSTNGTLSGKGGDGGIGRVRVTTYF